MAKMNEAFRNRWRVVIASAIGLVVSSGAMFGCFAGATSVGPFLSGLPHAAEPEVVPA
jgi:hypothetical protein